MRFTPLLVSVLVLVLLSPALFAYKLDSIFGSPLRAPKEIVTTNTLSSVGTENLSDNSTITVVTKAINLTLLYPFDPSKVKFTYNNKSFDSDDTYVLEHYNMSSLIADVKNASSISDVYNAVRAFDENLSVNGSVNCKVSTSAFKIAFLSSPLANQNATYKLMKAFVHDGYNAHRFIVLSNANGNFVIDPLWGMNENLSQSVKNNSALFYDDPSSPNYRGKVDRVSVFFS